MKVFTMANVVTAKRGAIFVCVVLVAALFIHNSKCLCSSFFNNDRALSQLVEIVDQLFPPAVTICFPIMAILDINKVPLDLLSICRANNYFTATKNGKIEYDDECVKALTNWANESSWHSVKPCNLTYTLWDLVQKVEVLDPRDMRLVEYNITGPNSFMKIEVNATKMGDYNCFSINIHTVFANQSSIFYEKSKLTTDVLVDPFIELQFNSKVSRMDMSYLILHGNRTIVSGAETRFLLEYDRSYIVGYDTETKNYVPGNFFGDSCMDYGKETDFASQCDAIFSCMPKDANYTGDSYAKQKAICRKQYEKEDCSITCFSPVLVGSSSSTSSGGFDVSVQLNLERSVITSKPRVDLEELFTFETGIIGFYFGFNLIGISRFYTKYSKLFTHRDELQISD